MHWDDLFDDLAGSVEQEQRAERESDQVDRARAERAVLDLGRRLRGHLGARLTCDVLPDRSYTGVLREVGAGWIAMDDQEARWAPASDSGGLVINLGAVTLVRCRSRRQAVRHRS